jgi:histidinol-phosphate aminotransferase
MKVSPDIAGITPYPPGKPLEELARELGVRNAIKLASNENPLGPSPKALKAIREGLARLHRYPDGSAYVLREALAKRWKLDASRIILGNGSNEVIELLVRTFLMPGDEAIMADPTFSLYKLMVTAAHGKPVAVPLKADRHDLPAMADRIGGRTRLIFVCNPNNPTGSMVGREEVGAFLRRVPQDVLVVFDEAYGEYVTDADFPDTLEALREGKNIVVLHTFSKIYGLAGLRVGYGLGPADVVDYLHRIRQPFNTSAIAQWAALAALSDERHVARSRKNNATGRAYLSSVFDRMGVGYIPSQTNFIYFRVPKKGREIYERLLREGVIIRHIEGNHLRVTIGVPEENLRFVRAFQKIVKGL